MRKNELIIIEDHNKQKVKISHFLSDEDYDHYSITLLKYGIEKIEDLMKTNSRQTLSFSE